jgi:hypothetical protein
MKWALPEFDDKQWSEAPGGFGTSDTPGAVVGTVWNTAEIWLRRRFTLADFDRENVFVRLHHDEDVEVFLNGVPAAKATGYSTDYQLLPIAPKARAALRAGENILSVHCKQTGGGQYVDVGVVEVTEQLQAE